MVSTVRVPFFRVHTSCLLLLLTAVIPLGWVTSVRGWADAVWSADVSLPVAQAYAPSVIYVPGGGTEAGDAPTSVVEKLQTAPPSNSLPSPWASTDIGAVGVPGSATYSNDLFTVKGAGEDIWGHSDSFHFLHRQLSGDGQVVARLTEMQNTNAAAKSGVMLRASLAPDAPHVLVARNPGGGIEFMTRNTAGGGTSFITGVTGTSLPLWLRLVRTGTQVAAALSTNGTTWTQIGTVNTSLPTLVYGGLPVLSHDTTVLNTSTFDSVTVTSGPFNPPPTVNITAPASNATFFTPSSVTISASASDSNGNVTRVEFFANGTSVGSDTTSPFSVSWTNPALGSYTLTAIATDSDGARGHSSPITITVRDPNTVVPAPWDSVDIGPVAIKGSASYSNGVFTVEGSGADIWDSSDSFRVLYQPWNGDGQITARVLSMENTHFFAKAGVMFRESLTAGSPHVIMGMLPNGGVEFMSRSTQGGSTTFHAGSSIGFPGWLKLIRSGTLFSAYTSPDGVVWTHAGNATVPLAQNIFVGLPVVSIDQSQLNTATFDNVVVSPSTAPPTAATSFTRRVLAVGGATSGSAYGIEGFQAPTSMQLGPDGRLYVTTVMGHVYILTLDRTALSDPNRIAVTHVQRIDDIYLKPSRTCNIGGDPANCQYQSTTGSGRLTLGLLIDPASAPGEITLYVSNSGFSQLLTDMAMDTYSGTVTRLRLRLNTATADPNDYQVAEHADLVVGLPRSREVHAVNGMSIGPDGWLYLAVGGNTNAGQPSEFFANLPEYYLSAAVVRLNLSQLTGRALPIDVSAVRTASDMTPYSGLFELFATGYRNPYDLAWHTNGKLYLNDNAANEGQGNTPGASVGCQTPSISPGDRPDDLNLVTPGAYGGHPNPARGECVFDDGGVYSPKLAPVASYVARLLDYRDGSSTNGIAEYTSNAFDGLMKGNLISATFAGNQNVRRVVLNSGGTAVIQEYNLGAFVEPLDVVTDAAGNIFVAEHGANRIAVMTPTDLGTCPVPGSDPAVTDSDGDGYTDADETANNTAVCSPAGTPADFDGDKVSDLNDADDDNDGIVDAQDQLFFDSTNGSSTAVPLGFEYNPTNSALGRVANTGFTGVQIAASGVRLSPSTIKAGDAGGHLTLGTHAGTAVGAVNSQVNALQIGFDGTAVFRVLTRVVQPFASTTPAAGHAGGIFFGPGQDNFLRLAVVGTASGTVAVQAGLEVAGSFTVRGSVNVTSSPIAGVDLVIVGDPVAQTLSAYVDVNGSGTLTPVARDLSVPAAWFSNNSGPAANTSLAGIMVTHGASTATAFGFDYFRIDRSAPPDTVGPPTAPSTPSPANGAPTVPASTSVSWAASQHATHYDVRFGTSSTPPLVSSNQTSTTYQPSSTLAPSTTYFWQVIAHGTGGTTAGPVWSFTTAPPDVPLPPSTSLRRLRVLTWNVNAGRDAAGTFNVEAQISLMARSGAHVIVLQEVTIENGADLPTLYQSGLSAATGKTWSALWVDEPRPSPAVPQGNLVLTSLPLGSTETIDLDAAPTDPAALDAKRAAGRVTVVVNDVPVTIITTALAVNATSRQAQINRLQSWIETVSGPRLLGGSLGMRPGEPGYTDLAATLADVWPTLVTTNDAGVTTEAFGSPPQPDRVDSWWQELTGGKAIATEVWIIKTMRSNHHAVIAEVNVR